MDFDYLSEAKQLRAVHASRYCSLVSFAILYYDYFLTISDEVELFWKTASFSWASTLFVLNRYLGLFGHIPVIVVYFASISETVSFLAFFLYCRDLQTYHQYFALLTQAIVAALLVMRTYALYDRSRRILTPLLALCAVGGAVSCWAILTSPGDDMRSTFQFSGCDLSLSTQQGYHLAYAWSSLLLFDTVAFLLTLFKAVQVGKAWRGGLFYTLLRDGTVYYGVLVSLIISNILSFVLAPGPAKGITTTLANVVSSTLVARLMLNLRNPTTRILPGMSALDTSSSYDSAGMYTSPVKLVFSDSLRSSSFDSIEKHEV